ncbi:hypothetical protein BKG91_05170 [Rodentibacter caecimuris]|uniref:Glutaredoxin n=1 Tax=Rodentibacter caecimuris TaxID=1796644 RepID=A0AAJ3K4H6_9PAST|nr:hypothetical protein [Rodentibacter heylii]AOF53568.1 Glutaredoxin-related protein [Pasteurellaceae bacterium NI1060]MCQ9124238.1 hypothetical protein [Rodentibacter heylii]OOF72540.1 hypothetical protein BKG90_03840 [Rodentibacter heylii]OOF74798.1 hypothetical protein BKG91_05170 [Rodentibacter heylii]OOF78672.1 hypothetical protein BKG99_00280 [Rodentibacter heylii]
MKPILYYAEQCPDTALFVAKLQTLGISYEAVEILQSLPNFKRFLKLRDSHSVFDNAKANGYVGIPALVIDGEKVVLDLAELDCIFG